MPRTRWPLLLCLCLLAWGGILIQPSVFIADDAIFIVQTQVTAARAFSLDSYSAAGYVGAPPVVYRPLGALTLAWESALFGTQHLWPWHALSLVGHLLNATLLALWLRQLGVRSRLAWLASSLWALSPLQAECLAWSSAQFDLFSATLSLGALCLAGLGSLPAGLSALGLFAAALLFKETMITVLPALALTAWLGARARQDRFVAQSLPLTSTTAPSPWLLSGLLAAGGGALLLSWLNLRGAAGVNSSIPTDFSIPAMLASLGGAVMRGLGFADLLPVVGPAMHPPLPAELLGLVLLAGGCAWSLWKVRPPVASLAVCSLLLPVVPSLMFGQRELSSLADPDRYFYLASVSLPAALALAVSQYLPTADLEARLLRRPLSRLLIAICLAWLSFWSIREVRHWQSWETVISRRLELGSEGPYLRYLRGLERLNAGRPCEAMLDLDRCLEQIRTPGRRRQCQELRDQAAQSCQPAR